MARSLSHRDSVQVRCSSTGGQSRNGGDGVEMDVSHPGKPFRGLSEEGQHSHRDSAKLEAEDDYSWGTSAEIWARSCLLWLVCQFGTLRSVKRYTKHTKGIEHPQARERDVVESQRRNVSGLVWSLENRGRSIVPHPHAPDPAERAWPQTPVSVATVVEFSIYVVQYWCFIKSEMGAPRLPLLIPGAVSQE